MRVSFSAPVLPLFRLVRRTTRPISGVVCWLHSQYLMLLLLLLLLRQRPILVQLVLHQLAGVSAWPRALRPTTRAQRRPGAPSETLVLLRRATMAMMILRSGVPRIVVSSALGAARMASATATHWRPQVSWHPVLPPIVLTFRCGPTPARCLCGLMRWRENAFGRCK